jgi:hypothetical protein
MYGGGVSWKCSDRRSTYGQCVDKARILSVSNTIQDHSALKEQFHAYDRYLFSNFIYVAVNGHSVQDCWILQRRP